MAYAISSISFLALILLCLVLYYRSRAKSSEKEAEVASDSINRADERAKSAEVASAVSDAKAYQEAQERAKDATVSESIASWDAATARARMRTD